ncbi:MAG: hypothetical protein ACRDZ3_09550 [Acidimicrobiia bacterium]
MVVVVVDVLLDDVVVDGAIDVGAVEVEVVDDEVDDSGSVEVVDSSGRVVVVVDSGGSVVVVVLEVVVVGGGVTLKFAVRLVLFGHGGSAFGLQAVTVWSPGDAFGGIENETEKLPLSSGVAPRRKAESK